jgi:integrase
MLKLYPPRPGHPSWQVRGKYLGVRIERSTGARDRKVAVRIRDKWKDEIERGAYATAADPTFASAALSYMQAGGERLYLEPLIRHFGTRILAQIGQADIDGAAVALYPAASPATRNRYVYTPVSAVLRHGGVTIALKRPKGASGDPRLCWLSQAEAFALLAAAGARHPRFGALCTFLLYSGCRLSEALRLRPADIDLPSSYAFVPTTKNGDPRPIHLPPVLVAALANIDMGRVTAFGFSKAGRIYNLLDEAATAAGVKIPDRVAFHIFRHTYGAWMRRYGGLDTSGLVGTGAWKSRTAAAVYEHVQVSEEARKADLLPTPDWARNVRTDEKQRKAK